MDPGRLRLLSPATHVRHGGLDIGWIPVREDEGCQRDHLAVAEVGTAVAKAEILGPPPLGSGGCAEGDLLEYAPELPSIGVRIHPDGTSDRAWDVHPELQPGEPPARRLLRRRGQHGSS